MSTDITWKVIDKLFKSNPNYLVKHHLDSYNNFFKNDLVKIIKENNPIKLIKNQDPRTKQFKNRCELYLGGKSGDRIYYGKPIIVENDENKIMYPNIARLRNMTYSFSVHYDLEVFVENDRIEKSFLLEKILLGRFPIMLQSDLCVLNKLNKELTNLTSKNLFIIKRGKNSFELITDSYNTINSLKNDYIVLKNYGFEQLDIKANE